MTLAPAAVPGTGAAALDALADLVADGDVVVLTGAGLSTDSGIPDYRGATGSLRRHTPMTYQTFTRDPRGRHRYWARSFVGWRQLRAAPAQRRGTVPWPGCRTPGCWPASSRRTSTVCTRPAAPATSSSCTAGSTGRSASAAGTSPTGRRWTRG
ncbi:Conserved protein of unknown function [Blastococcus saxobsidens DD2]|uniref:Uncharacterized protein n=1 Tax=Blastococcus saxobsidens (strain DD2) TaxID=1146883 RepID=H6RRN1_BLASD|nr:Conserved protein of unknown function [Blastococcus saxobsidens DD2]